MAIVMILDFLLLKNSKCYWRPLICLSIYISELVFLMLLLTVFIILS